MFDANVPLIEKALFVETMLPKIHTYVKHLTDEQIALLTDFAEKMKAQMLLQPIDLPGFMIISNCLAKDERVYDFLAKCFNSLQEERMNNKETLTFEEKVIIVTNMLMVPASNYKKGFREIDKKKNDDIVEFLEKIQGADGTLLQRVFECLKQNESVFELFKEVAILTLGEEDAKQSLGIR